MRTRHLDSVSSLEGHYQAIRNKPFLRRLYTDFYRDLRQALPGGIHGPVVEIGAGAGFLRNHLPGLIAGDILPTRFIDVCFDAQRLPFQPNRLKGILMLNVFHHLPSAVTFLSDAARCLMPGGVIAMIEPWMTAGSHWVYRLFHHEATEKGQSGWDFESSGPLSGANQALAWIVFQRDRADFDRRFPTLRIETVRLHTPLRYLASGGLSHPFSAPLACYAPMLRLEQQAHCLRRCLSMFATIVVKRTR
jgi:SAM-dependent methyltransferase